MQRFHQQNHDAKTFPRQNFGTETSRPQNVIAKTSAPKQGVPLSIYRASCLVHLKTPHLASASTYMSRTLVHCVHMFVIPSLQSESVFYRKLS